ncbi:hypothetical protein [Nostoc sp.]|uniref:hypothetical protein n=1 Tax=Nostoc sp. TaxID=1180 RepID=UPI002FF61D24
MTTKISAIRCESNGTKKSPKTFVYLVPSLEAGNVSKVVKLLEAAALPEWVPALEAGNHSEQWLYLFSAIPL